jgi:hypothetical protein
MHATSSISDDLLMDNKVKNREGLDIGRVEELVAHPESGRDYAVVAFGGFLGSSDRLFVVPWDTLELDSRTRTFRLRVDRQILRTAPKFSRGQRYHLSPDYLRHVDAHFSPQPAVSAA